MVRFVLVVILMGCSISLLQAQGEPINLSNWRTQHLSKSNYQQGDTLQLDSATILPNSLTLFDLTKNTTLDTSFYHLKNTNLLWKKAFQTDSLHIQYRILPFNIGQSLAKKDTNWISRAVDDPTWTGNFFQYNPNDSRNQLITSSGLDYTGSYSRGLSVGNSQDLVLNSNFNMQLSGDIGDEIELTAAISDNNIPIQPQGNTQQLQDFDKVFIQLKRRKTAMTAGDYELRRPDSYFMNYFKKLQGLTIGTQFDLAEKGTLSTNASAAITRGKFARNTIVAIEGNQGPYKLEGGNGEQFVIILAGTEKVYIDGLLLTRGQNNDYVIDYNRGEIRFTPNQLITKDKRIIVEFEYNDQNYNRSLLASNTAYQTDKMTLRFSMYSEQDSRTSSTQGQLTEAQQQALAAIGDNAGNTAVTGIDSTGFNTERIMYMLVDTFVNGLWYDSVLVYSTNEATGLYTVRFSEIIGGRGNYVRLQSAANGAVFGWVAPDPATGEPQGTHEPIVRLVAPANKQLFTFGTDYQINKNAKITTEVALSNRDLNRLSERDGGDNVGLAAMVGYESQKQLNKEKGTALKTKVNYEFVQQFFNPLNPYRRQEFTRDWNTANLPTSDEHIGKASLQWSKQRFGSVQYELSAFLKDEFYTGLKHTGVAKMNKDGFDVQLVGNLLTTQGTTENSTFFRPKVTFSKKFAKLKNFEIGAYGEREQNQRRTTNSDSLLQSSFYYDMFRLYAKMPSTKTFEMTTNYTQRIDYAPVDSAFTSNTIANEINLIGRWKHSKTAQLRWNMTYRNLEILDTALTNQQAQETYLGRIEYNLSLPKGLMRFNSIYQISSGQEQRVQYNYVQVDAGQGTYSWIDRNEDGIKQLDEFEIAIFQDQADHIRVITFTDEYIRSNTVQSNQILSINPKAIWRTKKGFKKALSKFSTQSNLQITRKVKNGVGVSPWNPFQLAIPDSSLVSLSSNIRNSLFFNRIDPKFSVEIGQFVNQNRVVLTTGFESRGNTEQFARIRWNANKKISTKLNAAIGEKRNDSERFNSRDYTISFQRLEPELTVLFNRNFRTVFKYKYQNSSNILNADPETALIQDLSAELTFNQLSKSSIRGKFTYANVFFTGERNTPLEFAMLEGLQNGRNYLWNLTVRRSITKNVELNVSYEGRKTGTRKVVHVGRASVRALF